MVNCSPWYRSLAYMYCGACIYFVLVFFVHRDVIFSCICDHGAEFRRIGKCEETIILIIFIIIIVVTIVITTVSKATTALLTEKLRVAWPSSARHHLGYPGECQPRSACRNVTVVKKGMWACRWLLHVIFPSHRKGESASW